MSEIAENLNAIRESLPSEVQLIAVSKTKSEEDILQAYEAGQRDFGENRIQEMVEKYESLPKDIRWHMIGHVQGNKIKYMAPFVHLVHGIDKAKRVKELNKEAAKCDRVVDCLLQIHIAQEESKFGFDWEEATAVLQDQVEERYPNVRIRGLMGMATNTDKEEVVRREFEGLHAFFSKCQQRYPLRAFDILSMGMSGDYPLAVQSGSTLVRVGSAIFGSRQ